MAVDNYECPRHGYFDGPARPIRESPARIMACPQQPCFTECPWRPPQNVSKQLLDRRTNHKHNYPAESGVDGPKGRTMRPISDGEYQKITETRERVNPRTGERI